MTNNKNKIVTIKNTIEVLQATIITICLGAIGMHVYMTLHAIGV